MAAGRLHAGTRRALPLWLTAAALLLAAAALLLAARPAAAGVAAAATPSPTPTPTPFPPPSPWHRPPIPPSPSQPMICAYDWQMVRTAIQWRRYFGSKGAPEDAQLAFQTRLINGYKSIVVKRDSKRRFCMWRTRYIRFFDTEFDRAMAAANLPN